MGDRRGFNRGPATVYLKTRTARPETIRATPSALRFVRFLLLVLRRDPLDDACLRGRTRVHVALAVPADVAGLADLTLAPARAVADDAQDLAVTIQAKELAVQAGADPRIA